MIRKLLITFLFMVTSVAFAFAQTGTLKGTVTDAKTGDTVPAANVLLLKINKGTATDVDGNYSISNIPAGSYTLRITFVGYKTYSKEVTISPNETLVHDAVLETDAVGLDEVVVTGYTEQSRKRLTGSITTVQADELESIPVATFEQKLQGKSPGVFITSGSGQPGSSSTVRIRGSASITGNSTPLYILDGVPISQNDFTSINSNDIASISILKDASATAQYGSRGSNGVIVINTKTGKAGDTQVKYSSQVGVSVSGDPKFDMMNTAEKLQFEEMLETGAGWASSDQNPNATLDRQELLSRDRDWSETFFRKGVSKEHDLSVSGGNENARYFVSGSIFEQEGIGIRSALDRYSMRVNTDINATENFSLGFKGQGGYSESSYIESEGSVSLANPFAAAYLANPYERLKDENGDLNVGAGQTGANSYERLKKNIDDREEIKFVGKTYASFLFNNFELSQELSIDYRERDYTRWVDPNSYAGQNVEEGGEGSLNNFTSKLSEFRSYSSLDYRNKFAEKHQVDLHLGNEFLKTHYDSFGNTGFGLNGKLGATPASVTPGSPSNNMIPTISGGKSKSILWSVLGMVDYSFDEKYNLKATLRRDGSSRFGSGNKYALLWSLGGSWIASSEEFFSDVDFLDNLIIRGSYGKTGNQLGIGNYQSISTFRTGSYAGQATIRPSTPGNPQLKWETAYKANIGVDFSLLDNRLSGTVELYNERTTDLFIDQELSRTSGFTSTEINAGSMRNRGIEVSLSGDVIQTTNTLLSLNANYSLNKNEILDLGQVNEFETGTSIIREGLPKGSHYVVKWAGVDPATGAPLYYDKEGNVTTQFSSSDAVAEHGTWLPPVTGGFGFDFSWKNLSIRSQFNYTYGNKIFNNQSYFQENHAFSQFNQREIMLDMWQKPGDVTEIQSNKYARQFSSKDIEDGSYLRLRNVMVSYSLPTSLIGKYFDNVRLFVQGQNIYTWTAFTGFDPEEGNNIAQYSYPLPRMYTAGIDIKF
ncbi:SusC/RagA family TonB-linked outer membrane protein [Fodinibius halophilus]|uniref:SusC/RagA family TonB-linked outer membrane protein n=1 Tax=Fodinibius halophilus TaxID=1736908 RepID=A0A6M1T7A2_9BACT|nr:SusC/RagA family TonB-linked outer membrane protein [Fodinibius halophilus]NGP87871.1 SusC/RagA family TonB-linked outer membrane protein [Fodinibius halophilus]